MPDPPDLPDPHVFRYTVGFEPVTEEHQELTVFSMDVTSTHTSDCEIQYNVPALADGEIHTLQTDVSVDVNWTVVFMYLHQHIGGVFFDLGLILTLSLTRVAALCHATYAV